MRQASPVPSLAPVLLQQALPLGELAQQRRAKSRVELASPQLEPMMHQAQRL